MGTQYDQVVCDGSDISYSALSYLAELGHTKIGYVGEQNLSLIHISAHNPHFLLFLSDAAAYAVPCAEKSHPF